MNTWHAKKVKQVFSEIGSSEKGLSKEEVVGRLEKYGKNELVKKKTPEELFKRTKNYWEKSLAAPKINFRYWFKTL